MVTRITEKKIKIVRQITVVSAHLGSSGEFSLVYPGHISRMELQREWIELFTKQHGP